MIQNYGNYIYTATNDWLMHHGIKGQKWGIRRYQNPDGTLTAEGRERYGYKPLSGNDALKILTNRRYKTNFLGFKTSSINLNKRKDNDKTGVYKGIDNLIKDIKETRNIKSNEMIKKYNTEIKKHFDKPEVLKDFKEYMNEQFGGPDKVDDVEYVRKSVKDYIYWCEQPDNHTKSRFYPSKELKKDLNNYQKLQEETNKLISDYTNEVVGNLGKMSVDAILNKRNLEQEVNEIVRETKLHNDLYDIIGPTYTNENENEIVNKLNNYWKKEGGK